MKILPSLALLAVALVAACSSDGYQKLPIPAQDVRVSSPDVARIYVARDSLIGSLYDMTVLDGQTEVGLISKDQYLCWERLPGKGIVTLRYHGPRIDGGDIEGILPLECEAGEVYYYSVAIESSTKKPQGKRLDEKSGRALLAERDPAPAE